MRIEHFRQRRALGASPATGPVLRAWVQLRSSTTATAGRGFSAAGVRTMHCLALMADLDGWRRCARPTRRGWRRSLLVELANGQTVKRVVAARRPLRVNQVYCAVHAVLHDRRDGLLRQLGSAEIVAQVAWPPAARCEEGRVHGHGRAGAITWKRCSEAIDLLLAPRAASATRIWSFSTVGDRVFGIISRRCYGAVRPALALSLHTTDAALREKAAA